MVAVAHRDSLALVESLGLPVPVVLVQGVEPGQERAAGDRPGAWRGARDRAPGRARSAAPSRTSPGRPTGSRPASGARAGERPTRPTASSPAARSPATGRPAAATRLACCWPRTTRCRRSSPATTRWRWACCAPCTSRAVGCPRTSPSSGSTTCPRPGSSGRRSRTVRQDFATLGRRAVDLTVRTLQGEEARDGSEGATRAGGAPVEWRRGRARPLASAHARRAPRPERLRPRPGPHRRPRARPRPAGPRSRGDGAPAVTVTCGDGVRRNVVLGHATRPGAPRLDGLPRRHDRPLRQPHRWGPLPARRPGGARSATNDRGNALHGGPDGLRPPLWERGGARRGPPRPGPDQPRR